MTNSNNVRGSALGRLLGGASVAALSLAVLVPGVALAQEATATAPAGAAAPTDKSKATELQTVVVTGSRIARRDYTSNSPIQTVTSQQLMNQADLQIQDTLNKLPEFSPDQNLMGANAGDVQPTPTHSVGIATASLRGLGPNRNLVLIDGQRAAPVNGELVVDLSTIPQSMIDHVEAITGGASAVYGADAIGGVVNFIMKKNFHGMDLDIQEGINQTGDGKQFQASVVMGTNFADDKGNLTVALERFQDDASLQKDHSFYTKAYNDPTVAGNGFFPFGAGWGGSGLTNTAAYAAGTSLPTSTTFWFNGGQLFTGLSGFGTVVPVTGNAPAVNGVTTAYYNALNTAGQVTQTIKENQTVGYVQSPLERWSMFTNGHYDINEWVTATFQANFSQTHTSTLLTAPISAITGWTTSIPYDSATNGVASGHPVPAQLAALLNSRSTPNAPWTLSWLPSLNGPLPDRSTDDTNTVYQIRAGLQGKIPKLNNWTWELNGSHSESMEYTVAGGDWSLARFQTLLTAPNWGQGKISGNLYQPSGTAGTEILGPNFGFGSATVTCTSGFYNAIFNGGALSQDCLNAINAPLQSMDITRQDVVEFDSSGDLFKLPAGTVKASVGADYRRDALVYNPDILQSNQSITDEVIGVYPTAYSNVSQDVKEGYGELEIPLLADLPFIKNFTLNPGVRYSSYNTSQGGWTYKILGDYQVNDWIRLRGGYNLAVRAPNLGELFEGSTEVFGAGSSYGDACSLLSTAPWGAGGAAVAPGHATATAVVNTAGAAGAANAYAICQKLMTAAGPAAASYFYTNTQPTPGPAPFAWTLVQGNTSLLPETAKTYTAGTVLKSPFQNPVFSRATLSIDFYKIHIDNAIEYASIDYIQQQCLSQPAATALNSIWCQSMPRDPRFGSAGTYSTPSANLATIDTSGVDVQFDYSVQLADIWKSAPGRFSLSIVSTFLGNYDTTAAPGQPIVHWYGSLGPTLTGTNAGAYAYKLNTSFGYSVGPATFNLNWRHLPQVNAAGQALNPASNLTLPTSAYDIFDLNSNFTLPYGLLLRAGIQNLLDTQPPTTGATKALSVGGVPVALASDGAGTTNPSYYDVLGRRFFVGLKVRF
jgi:iron complex outermembrane receptor protein